MMRHRPPWMVLRRRLWEPHVARITRELSAFECPDYCISLTYLATCGVHDIRAALHFANERITEHMLGLWVKRAVDGHHVANTHHRFDRGMIGHVQFPLDVSRKPMLIRVMQFDIERFQPPQDRRTDPACANCSDLHAFQIVSTDDTVGDVPAPLDYPLVGRNVVSHQ